MKIATLPILALLSLAATAASAQAGMSSYDLADLARYRTVSAKNLNKSTAEREAAIAGTPPLGYYNQGWNAGTVQQIDGQSGPVTDLRYNLKLQWLEVKDATVPGGIRVYPGGSLKGFTLVAAAGQVPHQFQEYKYSSPRTGSSRGFLEVLNRSGDIRLLVRHTFEDRPAEVNIALNTVLRPAQQLHVSTLFAVQATKPDLATELALDRRGMMRLFKSRAGELDDYAKAQKLDYTSLDDALKLVDRYNTLLADNTSAK